MKKNKPKKANKDCNEKRPSNPSIQLNAFATPTIQKIVKVVPKNEFNFISPKPARFPKEVRLKSLKPITIPEQRIKVMNLNHTGSSKTSSKKDTTATINPVKPINNAVLMSTVNEVIFSLSVSKSVSKI